MERFGTFSNQAYQTMARSGYRLSRYVLHGALAGIGGGIAFGTLASIFNPGMIPGMGRIIGIEGMLGGWTYHLFNSLVIGSIFGLVLGRVSSKYLFGALWGLAYGFIWWILGGLILFPLMMGLFARILTVSSTSWVGLVAHLAFGVVTGTITVWLNKRP